MGKIILCEGAGANLAYCPQHDWWHTVQGVILELNWD